MRLYQGILFRTNQDEFREQCIAYAIAIDVGAIAIGIGVERFLRAAPLGLWGYLVVRFATQGYAMVAGSRRSTLGLA